MGIEIELDPDIVAGQMVVGAFEGRALPAEVEMALAGGLLSGVILFESNLGSPEEVRDLTDAVRDAAPVPPFIAIDQEGGRVQRLKEPFTVWPSMKALGKKNDAGMAREVAGAIAAELLSVGINTNFAPVLDVDSNPDNPVIGDRSLGSDPGRVARLGAAMIEGFNHAGLISCAKHFPGHGDTSEDSHHEMPTADADRETLDRRELVPFAAAIKAKVPAIMTAHVKVPALDNYYPATISPTILDDLLRIEMGFDGVIVADDLEMGAIARNMPIEDAAFSAARAGVDLMLVCAGPDRAETVRGAIAQAIKTGALDFAAATAAARRVIGLKERLLEPVAARELVAKVVGREEHLALVGEIEA